MCVCVCVSESESESRVHCGEGEACLHVRHKNYPPRGSGGMSPWKIGVLYGIFVANRPYELCCY